MARYKFDQIAVNSTEKKKPIAEDRHTYLGLEHLDSECLQVTRFGSDVAPIGEKLVMRKGDVLFGKRRAYQRKVAIAPFDGIFSAHGMVLRPRTDVITPELFPFFVSSKRFLDAAIQISVGSLSPTINWRDLKELEFEIPPLDEQRRLAEVLWAANDTKQAYQCLLAKTDELVKAQFVEMFGEPGKDEKGWGIMTLADCCEINPRKSDDKRLLCEPDVSFVAMPSVSNDGKIDATEIRPYIDVKNGFTYFADNDVLFAKITPCMENGKGAVAINLHNGLGFGSTEFHVLRPKPGKANPFWIYFITMFREFRENAEKQMTGTGGQRRVPTSFLEHYRIAAAPITLQDHFADFANSADQSKLAIQQSLNRLEQTRTALMDKAFG